MGYVKAVNHYWRKGLTFLACLYCLGALSYTGGYWLTKLIEVL